MPVRTSSEAVSSEVVSSGRGGAARPATPDRPITADLCAVGTPIPEMALRVPPPHAAAPGSRDGFLNMLLTMRMVEHYVQEWAGPYTMIKGLNVKLDTAAHPGDLVVFAGVVVERAGPDLTIEVHGRLPAASHATATVRLALPSALPSTLPSGYRD
ncbi:hypothetical protein [Spongiactinospora sp. TRM90649]|uniref:hypothetical protein n=1 Tax=Spongiactinospora sp. TRM90649 TaxID=3031114 RepID=UPI0023F82CCD|nr:hypothetical protein [Spongiactinospora sp. TRM90649]MDF5756405.1 hypothetical protein [Spongiactinospora sp. TRM90649]